jgi:hypothetical protein
MLVAGLVGLLFLLRWFVRTPPEKVVSTLKRAGLWVVVGGLVGLTLTGRLHWLLGLLAAALPFGQRLLSLLQLAPLLQRLHRLLMGGPARPATGGQRSTLETRFLRMTLDHDSGALDGTVLEGTHRGRALGELSLGDLLALLATCREADSQSAAVLEAYLDRAHGPAWRQAEGEDPSGAGAAPGAAGTLNREQAYAILGLPPGATAEEVRDAHRRLMQKMHPDRGGSTYLAALINQARDLLVGE